MLCFGRSTSGMCVCARPVWGENRREECCRLHMFCLYPLSRQVSGTEMTAAAALACPPSPYTLPPAHDPPRLCPVVWCHGSWCLHWRTPTAPCKVELKGRFNFSDSAWTVVVLSLLPMPPSLFSLHAGAVVSSKQPCKLVRTLIVFLFVVFYFPASWFLLLFSWAQGSRVMNPYWSFKQTQE